MTEIINFIKAMTPQDWSTIAGIVGAGAAVSIVLQTVKHYLQLKEAKKVVMFLLGAFSFLASFADWFLQFHASNPAATAGRLTGWIFTAAVILHRIAISPLYYKVTSYFEGIYKDAKLYRQEVTSGNSGVTTSMDVVAASLAPAGAAGNDFSLN